MLLSLLGFTISAQTTNNLQLWLKPEGLTNTVAASPITFWTDSAGSGYHATNSSGTQRPTYDLNVANGYSAAHFTGDGAVSANLNYLQSPLPFNATTNPFTTFIVYKADFAGARDQLIHQIGGYAILYLLPNSSPLKTNLISNASGQLITNSLPNDSTWKIISLVEDATTIKMYENGVLVGSAGLTLPATATSGGGWVFGARQDKTRFGFNGDIAEILVYNTNLNSNQLAVTENYLTVKYGLNKTVLLSDNFDTLADPAGINDDLDLRQTGLLAPATYYTGGGPVNITSGKINLDNSFPSGGYDFFYATSDLNILPYEAGAKIEIDFDIINFNAACLNNQNDSWASFSLSQYTVPGGPVTDWGMLIRTNGTGFVFGAFTPISVTPTNIYHVHMSIVNGYVSLSLNGTDQGTSSILCPLTYQQSKMSFGLGSVNNGADAVTFDNLLVTRSAIPPSPLPPTLKLSDNFNSADSPDINANLSRQVGPAAPSAWITNGNLNTALIISGNTLLMTNAPGGGVAIGMASQSADFRQLEHLNSFKMSCTVSSTNDAGSNDSWVGLRFRDNTPSHFVADADGGGSGINFFTGDGRWYFWQSFLGATNTSAIVASGTVPVATNYLFEIEVRTNRMWMRINGLTLPLNCGDGVYNLPAYQAANFVTLQCLAQNPATTAYAAYDNFTFESLDPGFTVPSPTIINPAYANSAFKLSLNSVNPIFYAVDAKASLTAPAWNYLGGVVGNGGVVSYTNSPATSSPQFYRVRVP